MKYIECYYPNSNTIDKLTIAQDHFDAHHGMGYGTPVERQVNIAHTNLVQRLFKPMDNKQDMLLHAVVGISGEAGELLDAIKKHVYYDKELDIENVIEELGDLQFYIQAVMQLINVTDATVKAMNIHKLEQRYPSGQYSNEQAQARADKVDNVVTVEEEAAAHSIMTSPHLK